MNEFERTVTTRRNAVYIRLPALNIIMPNEDTISGFDITHERIIQLMNEDLAGKNHPIAAYTLHSQELKESAKTDLCGENGNNLGDESQHGM